MKEPVSRLLASHHATMVSMTTPESPRNRWPQRQFRLDDETWKQIRMKLAADEENWQGVMETLARDWLAGKVTLDRPK